MTYQIVALRDFQVNIGEDVKVYPFLTQRSILMPNSSSNYLREREKVNGVVYFEQPESWGGFLPRRKNGQVRVKVKIIDTFGRNHSTIDNVPFIPLEEARKYNPSIGLTRESLKNNKSDLNEPYNHRLHEDHT